MRMAEAVGFCRMQAVLLSFRCKMRVAAIVAGHGFTGAVGSGSIHNPVRRPIKAS